MDEAVIRLHIERLEEGGYVATSPDVPGLVAEGRSIVETVEIAQGLAKDCRIVPGAWRSAAAGIVGPRRRRPAGRGGSRGNPLMGRLSGFKHRP